MRSEKGKLCGNASWICDYKYNRLNSVWFSESLRLQSITKKLRNLKGKILKQLCAFSLQLILS